MKGSGYNVAIYKYSTIYSKFNFTNIFIEQKKVSPTRNFLGLNCMNFLMLVYTKMFKKSREEVYSMDNDKKRGGVRKGAGRKSTGRERDKTISFKVTDEEREMIYKILDNLKETRTGALLKILQEYNKK